MLPEIVFIVGKDPTEEMGGHSSYVRAHAKAATQMGYKIHLFCASPYNDIIETPYGTVHRIAAPFWPCRLMMLIHPFFISRGVVRFPRTRTGPHLLHSFGSFWGSIGVSVSQTLQRKGIKAITLVNSYTTCGHEINAKLQGLNASHNILKRIPENIQLLIFKFATKPYERRAYSKSQQIIINYESVRQLILAEYPTTSKFHKLPYTSETAFLNYHPSLSAANLSTNNIFNANQAPLIVAISRHDSRKGVDILLRALANLDQLGVEFRAILIGGGALLADHRKLANQLGLINKVYIAGWVVDPYAYLQQAAVFVLPSLQEGSGSISMIEALQAGVAIVASALDGIPEDVVDGESALLVPPGDVSALTKTLQRILMDKDLRKYLASRSRQVFDNKFSVNVFIRTLKELYQQIGF